MDVPQVGDNQFFDWVRNGNGMGNQIFYIPETDMVSFAWEQLGVTQEQYEAETSFHTTDDLSEAIGLFTEAYTEDGLRTLDIPHTRRSVNGLKLGRLINLPRTEEDRSSANDPKNKVQFVKGWIGIQYVDLRLKRAIQGDNEQDRNPFDNFTSKVEGDVTFLPDIVYLPRLYEQLGITSLEETGLTARDYAGAWEGISWIFTPLSLVAFEMEGKEDPEKIAISALGKFARDVDQLVPGDEEFGDIYYLIELPELVVKRLAVRIENLKNTSKAPLSGISRDLLQKISSPALRGKDLIGLCIQNVAINRFCNQENQRLFRERLQSEFNLDWSANKRGFVTPRELYVQLYKGYYLIEEDVTGGFDVNRVVGPSKYNAIARIVPTPDWSADWTNWFFFFPDHPDLSFIVHSDGNTGDVSYEKTDNILTVGEQQDIDYLAEEVFASPQRDQYHGFAAGLNDLNHALDFYVLGTDISLNRQHDANLLCVFRLE